MFFDAVSSTCAIRLLSPGAGSRRPPRHDQPTPMRGKRFGGTPNPRSSRGAFPITGVDDSEKFVKILSGQKKRSWNPSRKNSGHGLLSCSTKTRRNSNRNDLLFQQQKTQERGRACRIELLVLHKPTDTAESFDSRGASVSSCYDTEIPQA